jgi:predicted MFS family arabinose efflux permease
MHKPTQRTEPSAAYLRYVLGVMALISALNMADRQVVSILIEPIKSDLGLSDTQMGMLTGLAFALFHAVAAIPIALWADRSIRRTILAVGVGAWSALTMATGLTSSFASMFAIRIGVGVGEGTGGPPAHSLVSDYFPPHRRSSALAVLIVGAPIGSMIAYGAGGWINEWLGWRAVFFLFGGVGLVVSPLIYFTIREPARGQTEVGVIQTPPPKIRDGLRSLLSLRSYRQLLIASALNSAATYTLLIWAAPFLMRVHHMGTGAAGTYLAFGFSAANIFGILLGGSLTDRFVRRDLRWLLWAPALASAVVAPFAWGFLFFDDLAFAIPCLAATGLLNAAYVAPVYAAGQNLSTTGVRALASAVITLGNTILGLGIGPVLVGWMNDFAFSVYGEAAIRYSLAVMLFGHVAAAAHLWLASRTYAEDTAANRGSENDPAALET